MHTYDKDGPLSGGRKQRLRWEFARSKPRPFTPKARWLIHREQELKALSECSDTAP